MKPTETLRAFLDKSAISAGLGIHGFENRGLTWVRMSQGIAHVVDVQLSRYSDPKCLKFTINLGVAIDQVLRICAGHQLATGITESECFPRFRIADLTGGFSGAGIDTWWGIQDGERDAAEVKSCLLERCLPILSGLDSVDAVYKFVKDRPMLRAPHPFTRLCWAVVCHLQGDAPTAESELHLLLSNRRLGGEWKARLDSIRGLLGQGKGG